MKISRPKLVKTILISIAVLFVLNLGLKHFIIGKIETLLSEKLPSQIQLTYNNIDLNTFGRTLTIKEPKIQLTDSSGNIIEGTIRLKEIAFKNFALLDYVMNDNINLNTVLIGEPTGFINDNFELKASKNSIKSKDNKTMNDLGLKHFIVKNANLKIIDDKKDSLKLSTIDFNLKVDKIKVSNIDTKPSIAFESYAIDADSIFMKMGTFETLRIHQIKGTNSKTILSQVALKTKYKPESLHRYIKTERDHYDIVIDTISVEDIVLDLSLNQPKIDLLNLNLIRPNLKIYRDKLVADDVTTKPMISEMLRNIPLRYDINNFNVKNASLSYKERVHDYNSGGNLFFTQSDINIQNLSNKDSISPVKIDIRSYFFGKSPVKAELSFDIKNLNDDFIFKAEIDNLDLNDMNSFTTPNLNASMSGEFKKMFYTITGNKNTSTIDLKVDYTDVKVSVLNKTHKNKLLSGLANLMVSNSTEKKKSKFKEDQATVIRDKTKSNINYIVLNVKSVLTKILL